MDDENSLLGYLNSATQAAGNIYRAINPTGGGQPAQAAPQQQAQPSGFTQYLPWIAGAGVLLLVVVLVFARKR